MSETNEYTNYLKDVIFINEDDDYKKFTKSDENILKNLIMNKSFEPDKDISSTGGMYFVNAYRNISSALPEKEHSIENRGKEVEINISKIVDLNSATDEWVHGIVVEIWKDDDKIIYSVKTDDKKVYSVVNRNDIHLFKWKDCVDQCYNTCHKYVETEVNSTAYMLRILSASVLGDTENYKICFLVNMNNDILGTWYHDKEFFKINIMKKNGQYKNNTDWFEKEQYNIIKIDTPVKREIKPREQYLTIKIPNNNSIINLYYKNKNELAKWPTNEIGNLQFPRSYKNVINVMDKFIVPRIRNLNRTYIIINLLKILKAFTYDKNKSYSNPYIKDEENENILLNYDEEYKISNKVLSDGIDDNSNNRGLVELGVGINSKDNVNLIFKLVNDRLNKVTGLNLDIRDKLSNEEYRKLIKKLIDKLKEIQKEDTITYQKTFDDTTDVVTEPSGIIIKEDNQDPSTIKLPIELPIEYTNKKNGRFILGAGPSASGKTYNAGLIIEMMKMVDPSFPTFFMTIDGGTYREKSVIYQTIVEAVLNKKQYPGLTNLMSANIIDKFRGVESIFETDSIKKVINDYLLQQKEKEKFVVSLYVPDTLTYCGIPTDCIPKLQKYIDITGDNNWIGLMIYQHKTGGDGCPLKKEYKCVGCTESGKKREKTEGKKYSSDAWKYSYDHGLQTIQKAPKFRFVFHNGGKPGRPSIFEDLSEPKTKIPYDTNADIKNFFNKKNIIYINGELTKNIEKCNYLLKGCETSGITPKSPETQETSENIIRIDQEFIPYYQNKYIGIPKNLIDIMNKQQFDNINSDDSDDIVLLLAINNLITSGFLVLINEQEIDTTELDDNEKTYNYYKIDTTSNIDYNKVYDHINTLMKNESIILYELEKKDEAFINFYENKYIGINKTLDKNDEINKIMEKFIGSGVLKPIGDDINGQDLDENDRKYDYYKINMDDNIFHYFKDKDNFNKFIHDNSIIILDKEPNKGLNILNTLSGMTRNLTNKMFGVFNFTSLQKNGNNVENLQELQKLHNAVDESNIDIIVNNKNDAVILNNKNISLEITNLSKENQDIKVENITNTKGDEIITVEATTSESSNYLGDILKSIVSSAAAARGLFINKKNVDNNGNIKMNNTVSSEQKPFPSETNVDITTVTPAETVPFINKITDDNDIVINIPSKKKYIGVPKTVMTTDNEEKEIVKRLLTNQIMKKIEDNDLDQNLLETQNILGYNENEYDYYELNIEEYLKNVIDREKSMIYDELNILSNNNTLYIYEIEPEQAEGISNLPVSSLWNNFSNATKNFVLKSVGKMTEKSNITSGEKSTENVQGEPETNNKPPKCNKKTTAKNKKKTSGSKGTQKNTVESETPTSNEKQSTIKSRTQTLKNPNLLSNLLSNKTRKKDKETTETVKPARFSLRNRTPVMKYSE